MKKYLLIIPIFVIVILGAWALWPRASEAPVEDPQTGLPFGEGGGGSSTFSQTITNTEGEIKLIGGSGANEATKLWKLTNSPIAGFVVLQRSASTTVRYADRATGHVFDISLPKVVKNRVNNNTLPKIYKAVFRSDGNAVIYQSLGEDLETIESLSINLASTTTPARALSNNIESLTAGTGDLIYYIIKDSSKIVSSNFAGGNTRELFSSAFNNWRISPPLIYTKPNANIGGYLYSLSPLRKVAGPLNGLTAVSGSNKILYSYFEGGVLKLNASGVDVLPAALAEKCIWSRKNLQTFYCGTSTGGVSAVDLNKWYLGETSFSDYIWSFNTNTEAAKLIFEPTDFGVSLDVISPALSSDEKYLVFMNKSDLTLWAVGL